MPEINHDTTAPNTADDRANASLFFFSVYTYTFSNRQGLLDELGCFQTKSDIVTNCHRVV